MSVGEKAKKSCQVSPVGESLDFLRCRGIQVVYLVTCGPLEYVHLDRLWWLLSASRIRFDLTFSSFYYRRISI